MKKIVAVISVVMCLVLLSSCAVKLPDGMTEEKVIENAEKLVTILNDKDYETFNELCDSTLTDAMAGASISDAWEPIYAAAGSFTKIEKTTLQSANGFAVAIVQAKYASKNITFTLSFNSDYKLGGIYFK